jgi:hypothetical protein
VDNLQAKPYPAGEHIALGDHIACFDLDQVLGRFWLHGEYSRHIDQKVFVSKFGFGHHIQRIDFLVHSGGDTARHG